ncbi:MAG: DNA polymerase III subunit gamma/tau [Acidimicrobiia bacterium]
MNEGHQSLYRRYRSQRFGELVGQEHVVRALRNAVAHGTHGHAYLFSGPRGTGKTSTARILAKALNCPNLVDGEPCGVCPTCTSIADGTSFDVHELDAASNNGVDSMRELIERAALGSPGRTKVYILDEVHMLSKAAEAALLKTLEEPPDHVVFVLATTDPQKVSATIRSRCQPFEFHLISAADLERHVRYVIADAGLDVTDEAIEAVLRQGGGSARDTLSALDQVVAAGGVAAEELPIDDLIEALIARDAGPALVAVAKAMDSGRDPRTLADAVVAQLRDGFLALQAPSLVRLPDLALSRVTDQAKRLGTASIVRSMEVLGQMLVELRHAPDPRVLLEVALVRLTNSDLDTSSSALLERIERLERNGVPTGAPREVRTHEPHPTENRDGERDERPRPSPAGDVPAEAPATRTETGSRVPTGLAEARAALGAMKSKAAPSTPSRPTTAPASRPAPVPAPSAPAAHTPAQPATSISATPPNAPSVDGFPDAAMLDAAWNASVVANLKNLTRAMYKSGQFVAVHNGTAIFAVDNVFARDRCEQSRPDVEKALAAHFGRPIPMRLIIKDEAAAYGGRSAPVAAAEHRDDSDHMDHSFDPDDLVDAPASGASGLERLAAAFPGAEIIDDEERP